MRNFLIILVILPTFLIMGCSKSKIHYQLPNESEFIRIVNLDIARANTESGLQREIRNIKLQKCLVSNPYNYEDDNKYKPPSKTSLENYNEYFCNFSYDIKNSTLDNWIHKTSTGTLTANYEMKKVEPEAQLLTQEEFDKVARKEWNREKEIHEQVIKNAKDPIYNF